MLDEFFTLGRKGQIQAKLTLNTLLRLYEDVMQFQDVPQPRRRDIISTLNDNLLLLFSFAFEIILDQLHILESQTNDPQCAISLCREALAMLSGYLDSCRVDVLSQWKPHGVTEKYAAPELPFIRLLVDLIWLEGTRIEALDLLLLLLKRKQQGSDDSSSKLAEILFMDPISVNKILMVLCSTLNEPLTFSEAKYNILLLVSEIVSRLGCQMVSRWTKYASHSSPCECASRMEFSCSNISTHVLDCVLRITSHPIRMISASANLFWLAAFGSHDASLILRLTPFVPTLFMSWRRSLKKEGFPNDSGTHSEWARGVFDSDEYSGFFAKYRSEVIRCINLANSHWPVEILQMFTALANDLLKTSYRTTGDFEPQSECPSSLVCDWDVLELLIESTLASVKDGFAVRGQMDQFDHASSDLLRRFLQVPFSMDPNLRGKQIMCACVLMQHVDSRHDAELLVPLLSQTHFDGIGTEVTNLWAEPNCGMVEKCVLLEALILLCLRLPQSIDVQRDLLKQLVSHVTSAWSTPTPTSQSTPMLRLLTSCATGGSGLVSILGLDQPMSAHQDFQSPYVQMRITLGQNVLALLATSRRLSEPANSQQLQQITVPLLEPVVSSVFVVVRAFNELWLPDTRALVDPSVLPAFEMTEHVKYTLLSLQIGRTDKNGQVSADKSLLPLDNCVDSVFSEEQLPIETKYWVAKASKIQEGALDDNAVACELVEERLARLMSRTLMDLLRLIYTFNGCESLGAQSDIDQADGDDGMEDINMQAETKSVGPGHDVHTIGALARALIAAPTIDPQQVTADSSASCSDPLFLQCLSKCLTWPDSATCFKASQWIPTLIDAVRLFM
ncbi:exportin-5 [Paragonimus westermani]|uniref:Exportin-5 n=1 Tax=Paragonimus westermani TaxID=34504 RepID=A0A5J4NYP8_9TREM|nr:exportin-5 [Paragonimus westermani]